MLFFPSVCKRVESKDNELYVDDRKNPERVERVRDTRESKLN